jgi:hypothetical protein
MNDRNSIMNKDWVVGFFPINMLLSHSTVKDPVKDILEHTVKNINKNTNKKIIKDTTHFVAKHPSSSILTIF